MNECLVSVIIPSYNASLVLTQTIASVLNQSFSDFEVVIIDDGSTDNTEEVVHKIQSRDNRIVYFKQDNKGSTSARNLGWQRAKGKYICFLDSDDSLPQNALLQMYNEAKSKDLDILITSNYLCCNGQITTKINKNSINRMSILEDSLNGKIGIGPWGRIFKRNLYTPEAFNLSKLAFKNEDLFMNVVLILRSQKIEVREDIYSYNYTVGSSISVSRRQLSEKGFNELIDKLHKVLVNADVFDSRIKAIYLKYCYGSIDSFFYMKGQRYKDKKTIDYLYSQSQGLLFSRHLKFIRQCTKSTYLSYIYILYTQFIRCIKLGSRVSKCVFHRITR